MMKRNTGVRFPDENETMKENALLPARQDSPRWGEKLARNCALAGMLILTITAVRDAKIPTGKTVLSAVQEIVNNDWDERLGKISFVGHFFPESVSVFFEPVHDDTLKAPCSGPVLHAWTAREPYVGYASPDAKVYSAAEGQVMSVAHGMDEEIILRLRHSNGLECLYYNLKNAYVKEGDTVSADSVIGESLPDGVLIEVRRAGKPIDPTAILSARLGGNP